MTKNSNPEDMVLYVMNHICLDQISEFYPQWKSSGRTLKQFCPEAYIELKAWAEIYAQRKLNWREVEYIMSEIYKETC